MASKLLLLCAAFALANGDVSHLTGYNYHSGSGHGHVTGGSSYSAPVVGAATTKTTTYTTGSTGFGAQGLSSGISGGRSAYISGSSSGSGYNTGSLGGFGDATHSTYTVNAAPSVGLRSGFSTSGSTGSSGSSGHYQTGFIPYTGSSSTQYHTGAIVPASSHSSGSHYHTGAVSYGPSLQFDAANVGTTYSHSASGGVSEQFHGQQQEPIVTKNFYFFSGPEDHSEAGQVHHVTIGRPEKNLKVIFIKNPSSSSNRALIKAHHAPHEEKTVVYVLSKHDNDLQIDTQIDEFAPSVPVKPDVVFVKYKNNEEIAHLQEEVKSKLQHIGGHVQVSDEGAAPVRSITHESHSHGAGAGIIGSGSTTYTTSSNLGGVQARSGFGDSSSTYTVGSVSPSYSTVGDASTTYTTTSHLGGAAGRSGLSGGSYTVSGGSDSGASHGLHGASSTTVSKTTTTGGSVYDSAPLLHGLVGYTGSASEGASVAVAPAVTSSKTTYTKTTTSGGLDSETLKTLAGHALTEEKKNKEISRVIKSSAKLLAKGNPNEVYPSVVEKK